MSRHPPFAGAVIRLIAALLFLASASALRAIQLTESFAADYNIVHLGAVNSLPTPYGGIAFKHDDPNTLLIGGSANYFNGAVYSVGLSRDEDGYINGFTTPATLFAPAAFIDGGLTYGPGNVLFFTSFPTHEIGQLRPGDTSPLYTPLVSTGIASSVGSLMFVPAGFPGAGRLKVLSYNASSAYDLPYSLGGDGYFSFGTASLVGSGFSGPEGMVYVSADNDGFDEPSVLVSAYLAGEVHAYAVDHEGNPITESHRVFITGLTGAQGAVIDPLTGDFLFSTFGGGDQIIRVTGFVPIPEPALSALLLISLAFLTILARRHR